MIISRAALSFLDDLILITGPSGILSTRGLDLSPDDEQLVSELRAMGLIREVETSGAPIWVVSRP